MKNTIRKFITIALSIALMLVVFAGCSPKSDTSSKTEEAPKKVALIMEGAINDMSWNATAYKGLEKIEALGAQISYQESVPVSSLADSMRTYATEGYDVIYLSSNSYQDVALQVSAEFPDTQVFLINGNKSTENLTSVQIADEQQGFLMGAVSALITESREVGFVGGLEITPIINGSQGFAQGVKYVNPEVKVSSVLTGSMDDVNKAKETAKAMIGEGVDVLAPMANQAGLGVLEAAQEGGIKAIASALGQDKVAPDALVNAIVKDTSIAYEVSYQNYLDGKITGEIAKMGASEGVIYVSDWFTAGDGVSEETRAKVEEIYKALVAGEIKITLE